ncbi:MAG: acetylglutamate kinase [Bacteroidales bacterium]|nr:acetylglutamate kinase [Bacteroidales bacterium]
MDKELLQVVKVGGAVVEDPASLSALLASFAAMPGLKVLVHGGGRAATRVAEALGIESRMVGGRRVTDEKTLEVVTMVYGGLVNKRIVAGLQALGVNALGLTGADLGYMLSDKRPVGEVDYGWVGDVRKVDVSVLADLIAKGVVPVLAPLTYDGVGHLLNTNADTIASEAAKALAACFDVTLVYCFEKQGVLADPADEESVIPLISRESYGSLVDSGVVSGGMLPKLDNAFGALSAGVSEVVITRADALGTDAGTVVRL